MCQTQTKVYGNLKEVSKKFHCTHSTCANEQDIVGAIHGLHSVHQQFAKLIVDAHSDQEGVLSQWQHIFLKQSELYNQKCTTVNVKYIHPVIFSVLISSVLVKTFG